MHFAPLISKFTRILPTSYTFCLHCTDYQRVTECRLVYTVPTHPLHTTYTPFALPARRLFTPCTDCFFDNGGQQKRLRQVELPVGTTDFSTCRKRYNALAQVPICWVQTSAVQGVQGGVQDVQAVCKHCADLPTLRNALNISAVQAKSVRCRQNITFHFMGGAQIGRAHV